MIISLRLVIVARHESTALSRQKIQVRALVRLQNVVVVELPVAALEVRLRRLPAPAALCELLLGHEEIELPLLHVERDLVAVLDQRERAAGRRLEIGRASCRESVEVAGVRGGEKDKTERM